MPTELERAEDYLETIEARAAFQRNLLLSLAGDEELAQAVYDAWRPLMPRTNTVLPPIPDDPGEAP